MNDSATPRPSLPHLDSASFDLTAERMAQLARLFPEVVCEGKIDFDKLKATLGENALAGGERFHFTWAGKNEALALLQKPSQATLVPCPEESIDFDTTKNVFIEGDNLEVLKLLFKPYFGKVKLIYIDPPYNTGQDFVYPDNYADPLATYLQMTGQADAEGNLLTSNPETSGRYHSSWLSMMYPRLFLARQLLREDGVIFVSIDDHEVHHLRMLMNEVFGEENFVATVLWQKVFSPKNSAKHFSEDHDYVVVYAREGEIWRPTLLPRSAEANARYDNPDNDPRGPWTSGDMTARNYYGDGQYEVESPSGRKYKPSIGSYWRVSHDKFLEWDKDSRIWWGDKGENMPRMKRFLSEVKQGIVPQTLWTHEEVGHTQEAKKELLEYVKYQDTDNVLDTVKPTRLLKQILLIGTSTNSGDLVVDFFAGSCSTAHAVLALNREDGGDRSFIAIQLPERLPAPEKALKNLTDVGKERIRRVSDKLKNDPQLTPRDKPEDLGFKVFKLAKPHIRPWKAEATSDPDAYAEKLSLFSSDSFLLGWNSDNVLWEIALREGCGLNTRFINRSLADDCTVWEVTDPEQDDRRFFVCLDGTVTVELSRLLPLNRDDTLICRDIALDDTAAANLALQCRLKTI